MCYGCAGCAGYVGFRPQTTFGNCDFQNFILI